MRRLRFRESALLCTLIKRNADSSLLLSYEDSISTFFFALPNDFSLSLN